MKWLKQIQCFVWNWRLWHSYQLPKTYCIYKHLVTVKYYEAAENHNEYYCLLSPSQKKKIRKPIFSQIRERHPVLICRALLNPRAQTVVLWVSNAHNTTIKSLHQTCQKPVKSQVSWQQKSEIEGWLLPVKNECEGFVVWYPVKSCAVSVVCSMSLQRGCTEDERHK